MHREHISFVMGVRGEGLTGVYVQKEPRQEYEQSWQGLWGTENAMDVDWFHHESSSELVG